MTDQIAGHWLLTWRNTWACSYAWRHWLGQHSMPNMFRGEGNLWKIAEITQVGIAPFLAPQELLETTHSMWSTISIWSFCKHSGWQVLRKKWLKKVDNRKALKEVGLNIMTHDWISFQMFQSVLLMSFLWGHCYKGYFGSFTALKDQVPDTQKNPKSPHTSCWTEVGAQIHSHSLQWLGWRHLGSLGRVGRRERSERLRLQLAPWAARTMTAKHIILYSSNPLDGGEEGKPIPNPKCSWLSLRKGEIRKGPGMSKCSRYSDWVSVFFLNCASWELI